METKVEIPFDARVPEYYIDDVHLRMEIYQRLGDAHSLDEVDALFDELKDRFGKLPEQALWLQTLSRIRVYAAQRGITLVKLENVTLSFEKKSGTEMQSNTRLIGKAKTPKEVEQKIFAALS